MSDSCYINHLPAAAITVTDRGLAYGDGLFETLVARRGQLQHWSLHWQRLQRGCERLALPLPDPQQILSDVAALRQPGDYIVKLIVTRGAGQRGYRADPAISPTVIVSRHPLAVFPPHYYHDGVAVRFCDYRLPHNPRLAGLKHLNRLDQVLARQEWGDEFQEGLMLDQQGAVIEGVMSNVFSLTGNRLQTPRLEQAGVAGITRSRVMALAESLGLVVTEETLTPAQLLAADAVFLTNTVIGLWPVRQLQSQQWQRHPQVALMMQQLELLQ